MNKTGTLVISEDLELEYSGILHPADREVGIMNPYFEVNELKIIKGNALDLIDWCEAGNNLLTITELIENQYER